MAKLGKRRDADFTKKEMAELSACNSVSLFDHRMGNVSAHYNIDLSKLKQDKTVKKGESLYPAECGDLIALLARVYPLNPVSKQGDAEGHTTGTDVSVFYQALLEEIEELPNEIRETVYSLNSYPTAKKICIWTSRMIESLTKFVLNYVKQSHEDMGALLQRITVDMDKASYIDFCNQYILNLARTGNKKAEINDDKEAKALLKAMGLDAESHPELYTVENATLDYEIAKLINRILDDDSNNREKFDYEDDTRSREERCHEVYIRYGNGKVSRLNKDVDQDYFKGATSWKNMEERIRHGERVHEMAISTVQEIKQMRVQVDLLEAQLVDARERLAELEALSEAEKQRRDNQCYEMIDMIEESYCDECEANREEFSTVYDRTNEFVGRILWELLNSKK